VTTESEEKFLRTVRAALGHRPGNRRTPPSGLFAQTPSEESRRLQDGIVQRGKAGKAELLEMLKKAAVPLNMEVITVDALEEATAVIVAKTAETDPEWGGDKQICAWRHPLLDRLELPAALKDLNVPVVSADSLSSGSPNELSPEDRAGFRRGVVDSFIGVTAADYCVAESATLVLATRSGQPRSISLVPSIHIAVISADQILADFRELYALLRWKGIGEREEITNSLSFISGPSKTADIEATLVHGAHGPRELILIVWQNESA
jgi:L-lactate dehydrogenase complex protein LldG